MQNQLQEFKKFILRGNVVDLAVAVAIGAAFNSVVQALVKDFITPLIGTLSGKDTLASGSFEVRGQVFAYGDFINILASFIITAAVIFFLIVQPANKLTALANKRKKTEDPSTKKCPECLSEIPHDARRCKFCTEQQLISRDTNGPAKSLGNKVKPISTRKI